MMGPDNFRFLLTNRKLSRSGRSIRSQIPQSGTVAQLLCNSLEGIGQHYTLPRIELTGVVLDPSLPVAA
jgi:hypothetical protein